MHTSNEQLWQLDYRNPGVPCIKITPAFERQIEADVAGCVKLLQDVEERGAYKSAAEAKEQLRSVFIDETCSELDDELERNIEVRELSDLHDWDYLYELMDEVKVTWDFYWRKKMKEQQ